MKKSLILLSVIFILVVGCRGGSKSDDSTESSTNDLVENYSLEKLAKSRIIVPIGTTHDFFASKNFPDGDIQRLESISDIYPILKRGKGDYSIADMSFIRDLQEINSDVVIVDSDIFALEVAIAFNMKSRALKEEFDLFLKDFLKSDTFADMTARWIDGKEGDHLTFEFDPNGKVLKLGLDATNMPYTIMVDGVITGYDIELISSFAVANGYKLEFIIMNFAGVVSSITTGMVDVACGGICITEERQKNILFSDPFCAVTAGVMTVVKDESLVSDTKWHESIVESFHNNIIKESRYKLILQGLLATVIISLLSIILGTILGGGICFMAMSKYKASRGSASTFITIVRGTPVLVLLMINFYVIFASTNISPIAVAVISFAINFAAYVSEMFRTSIESIDRGQTEAGLAMGFTGVKTFIYIIAPQAIKQVLPVYKGEAISLIKMTSVVGYIAVQDITKVGDIIRSRTFDAFFPLLVSAVLYFILAYLFAKLLDLSMARIIRKR